MKLPLDQGLPRSACVVLRALGHDAVHVGDIAMSSASDVEIVDYARRDEVVIVTLDADFHALIALSKAELPSVVRIRIEGMRGEALAAMIASVVALCEDDVRRGAMVSVSDHGVRVRRLPLVRE